MDNKNYVIIMAAGHGTRMGSKLPKQFMSLGGKAILQRTIMKFADACPGIKIITVLPPDGEYEKWWKDYCIRANFSCPQIIVRGGITRFHSVKAALAKVPDGAIVAIHDGVRPMLTREMIRTMFGSIDTNPDCHALIPVLPSIDTLKKLTRDSGGNLVSSGEGVDRSEIFGAQTPQIFRSEEIKAAYSQPYDTLFTDDASVAERYKIPLTFCEGERLNFKITSPEDMILAEAVLGLKTR